MKANALYSYFQKLTKQSEAFLAGASQLLESGEDGAEVETAVQSVSLCGEIIAARDDLERAMKVLSREPAASNEEPPPETETVCKSTSKGKCKDKGKGVDVSVGMERLYAEECERLAFEHVGFPQTGGKYGWYAYGDEVAKTANATRHPKDRLHLIRELAVMATSLPPGVWVRVDEVRNDAMYVTLSLPRLFVFFLPFPGLSFLNDHLLAKS